jgi:hypothetical protein
MTDYLSPEDVRGAIEAAKVACMEIAKHLPEVDSVAYADVQANYRDRLGERLLEIQTEFVRAISEQRGKLLADMANGDEPILLVLEVAALIAAETA